MKFTKRALTAAVLLSCSCFLAPYYAHAEDHEEGDPLGKHDTYYMELSVNGQNFAKFEVYDATTDTENAGYYVGEDKAPGKFREFFTPDANHTSNEKDAIAKSMKYLVDMVGTPANTLNMNLKLFEPADANASAMSNTWLQLDANNEPKTQISDSQLTATYLGKMPYDANSGVGEITINDASNWYTDKFPVLPSNGTDSDYYGTITHEMFHAMGLGTYIRKVEIEVYEDGQPPSTEEGYFFGTDPNDFLENNQSGGDNSVAVASSNPDSAPSEEVPSEGSPGEGTIVFNKYEMGLRDVFNRVAYYEERGEDNYVYYDNNPIDPNAANPMSGVTGELVSREIIGIDLSEYTRLCNTPNEIRDDAFYVIQDESNTPISNGGAYFTGANVQEVLTTKGEVARIAWPDANANSPDPVLGLPLNGFEDKDDPAPELSHIELQNSLMSHQNYRNWCTYMEAEIALLQDLGYNIDRSKYFGKSIYNSGKVLADDTIDYFTYTNTKGFNSTQMHGIGLHVYGSYVDVTQAADIKADGDYGIGIRVDGVGNKVTINSNISANGEGGNGLLVAYGKEHEVTLNAGKTIEATGTDGVAARFDFGSNELSDYIEYRGSYIQAKNKEAADGTAFDERNWRISDYEKLPSALQGELVTNFNVKGALKGQQAAIYISPNAYVKNINLFSGASLDGDIISKWNPKKIIYGDERPALPTGVDGLTNLTFGGSVVEENEVVAMSDSQGTSTVTTITPDANFNMSYSGKIEGIDSLKMNIAGGTLDYNGTANVYNVTINNGSTLKGKGTYVLNTTADGDGGTFTNNGNFELGDGIATINITGDYEQSSSGNLLVDFNSDAGVDNLNINNGNATLSGKITLTPQVDYYFNGQQIKLSPIVNATSGLNAQFDQVELNNISPVLNFELAPDDTAGHSPEKTQYVINVSRVEQGYQSVADDKISAGIGSAIDNELNKPIEEQKIFTQDKQNLISTIDFSLTNSKNPLVAKKVLNTNIKKLNPNVVSSNAQAVLETHTTLNNLVSVSSSLSAGSLSLNIPVARRAGGLGPARNEPPKYNSWRNIVIPFSSYTDQHNGSNGYTNHNSGVIGAMERTFANGLTHGYHAAINHQSTEDSGSRIKGEGIYLGTHASYAPADWNGWSVFGSARIGVEQMRSHRTVFIPSYGGGGYFGTADGDWTGYSGSFNVGAALTKEHGAVKSGPFAALDYSFAHRPSVHEDGGAIRTNLESATYDSLRTQLGYRLVTNPKPLDSYDSTQWQAHASVAWNHELLSDNGRTNYQLADFPGATVEDDVETYGRDSMSIAAGVIFKTPNRLDVGLTLGSDIYRKGGSSVYGKVNFEWKF